MYQKVNRNSLGQQLRKRERLVHASTEIIPAHEVEGKDGVKHVIPARARSLHRENPLINPLRVGGRRIQTKPPLSNENDD